MRTTSVFLACVAAFALTGPLGAEDAKPNPVKSCTDVRAYMDADGTMTMETFKKVLIAGGMEWNDHREEALNNQCKVTAYVKQVIMVQHVAGTIGVSTQVITDNGVCKLTNISLSNC